MGHASLQFCVITAARLGAALGLGALASVPLPALSAEVFQGIAAEMTAKEQAAAGVDRLSTEERAALDRWLRTRFGQAAPVGNARPAANARDAAPEPEPEMAAEVARRVAEKVKDAKAAESAVDDDAPFEATLLPPFDGWRGKTIFRLDNGQVWGQRSRGTYFNDSSDLRVRFKKNWLGGWEMRLIEADKAVLVKRIR